MQPRSAAIKRLRHLLLGEDGGALAELAIVVPFLAVMLAGVSEFGRFFQTYTTLVKATRSASRYLSSHDLTAAEIGKATSIGALINSNTFTLALPISPSTTMYYIGK